MSGEYLYYATHQDEIIKDHRDEYVSIMGTTVLGYYKTHEEGLKAALEQFPKAKDYFIKRCRPLGEPEELTLDRLEDSSMESEWAIAPYRYLPRSGGTYISERRRYYGAAEGLSLVGGLYYEEHQEEIIKDHLNEYVAIMGTTVLGYYKTQEDGLEAAKKQFPAEKLYFIQKCRPAGEPDDELRHHNENITIRHEWPVDPSRYLPRSGGTYLSERQRYYGDEDTPMLEEYFYYQEHREEIIKDHLNEYVVIMGTTVLGYYKTFRDGFEAAKKQFTKADDCFIQKCRPLVEPDDELRHHNENITIEHKWTA